MQHSQRNFLRGTTSLLRSVRRIALVILLALGSVLAWLLWRGWHAPDVPPLKSELVGITGSSPEVLKRGAYLVQVGACMGCHTAAGGVVLAGGGEVRTPFGIFRAPNLTPDVATGLGRWNVQDFRRAMRHGVAPGGRLLYPAFPYEQYTGMRTEDIDAIFHYLRSLPAVAAAAQPHELRFPYGSQMALALWRGLYFRPAKTVDVASASEGGAQNMGGDMEVGRYLVQAVAHCAACHSPRNGLGALGGGQRLEGGLMPAEGWQAPSLLDSREAGVQRWSVEAIVQLLQTGRTDAGVHASASGPMADAVFWSTQYLTPADAEAVALYLKALPDEATATSMKRRSATETVADAAHLRSAEGQYRQYCAECHGAKGEGRDGVFPALAGNRAVVRADAGNMLRAILHGGYAPSTIGNPAPHGMPPFMQTLSDAEVAALATYIRNSWGNQAPAVATIEAFRARQGRP